MLSFLRRLLKKPDYWACYYTVKKAGSDRLIESGTFAVLGDQYDVAFQDAEKTLKEWVKYSFDVDVAILLHKPSWLERLH